MAQLSACTLSCFCAYLLAVLLPSSCATTSQDAQFVPGPCTTDDIICAELLGEPVETGQESLSLLQRAASLKAIKGSANATHLPWGLDLAVSAPYSSLQSLFVDVTSLDDFQLLIATIYRGYFLHMGAQMVRDGIRLLCFFHSVSRVVGSVFAPILGALPDGLMVLFSGLGPDAQTKMSTGMGAMVGSTVMMLTLPWFIVNMLGSVPLKQDGTADYSRNQEPAGILSSGVTFRDSVLTTARMMAVSSCAVLIIEVPSAVLTGVHPNISIAQQAKAENLFAYSGFLMSIGFFVAFIVMRYVTWTDDEYINVVIEGIQRKELSFASVLQGMYDVETNTPKVLRRFFHKYDLSSSGFLDCKGFELLLRDLGERVNEREAKQMFDEQEKLKKTGFMSFDEFCGWAMTHMIGDEYELFATPRFVPSYRIDEEEDEVLPDRLMSRPRAVQQRTLLFRAIAFIGFGLALVVLFSGAAVAAFAEWGSRLGVSPFYIGFFLAPFASNFGELFKVAGNARAKTSKKATRSFESLLGVACMNNSFCLAVFYALIYHQELAWLFKCETAGNIVIQWLMTVIVLFSNTQPKILGLFIILLYPLCPVLVKIGSSYVDWH